MLFVIKSNNPFYDSNKEYIIIFFIYKKVGTLEILIFLKFKININVRNNTQIIMVHFANNTLIIFNQRLHSFNWTYLALTKLLFVFVIQLRWWHLFYVLESWLKIYSQWFTLQYEKILVCNFLFCFCFLR